MEQATHNRAHCECGFKIITTVSGKSWCITCCEWFLPGRSAVGAGSSIRGRRGPGPMRSEAGPTVASSSTPAVRRGLPLPPSPVGGGNGTVVGVGQRWGAGTGTWVQRGQEWRATRRWAKNPPRWGWSSPGHGRPAVSSVQYATVPSRCTTSWPRQLLILRHLTLVAGGAGAVTSVPPVRRGGLCPVHRRDPAAP